MSVALGMYITIPLHISNDPVALFLGFQIPIFYIFLVMAKYVNMWPINSPAQEASLSVKSFFDIDLKSVLATLGLVIATCFTMFIWLPHIYPNFVKPLLSFLY